MMGILLDTTVLVDLSHGKEAASSFFNKQRVAGVDMSTSIVSSMELIRGCFNKAEVARAEKLLRKFTVFTISDEDSLKAYDLVLKYNKSHNLEMADALIAAAAISHEMQLFTDNLKHFKMIPDLVVSRPY